MVESKEKTSKDKENEVYVDRAFNSMFHIWYPKIREFKYTYKSKIIPVSNLFVETYLKADGLS